MTGKKISFQQFLDVILTELYKQEEVTGASGDYFDLEPLVAGLAVPQGWLWDAVDVLASQGYIHAEKFLGGRSIARLTGAGRLLKERGGQAGFVKEYSANFNQYHINVTGSGNAVVAGHSNAGPITVSTNSVDSYMGKIRTSLAAAQSITEEEKKDIEADLKTVETQLGKQKPNKGLVIAVLEGLARFSELVKPVRQLLDFLDSVL